MNKKGLIKFLLVFAATLLSFYYMTFVICEFNYSSIPTILILSVISITIFMYEELKNIKSKKVKFIYDIVLMLLTVASLGIIGYIGYNMISCIFNDNCSYEFNTISIIIYIPTLIVILLISITRHISNIFFIRYYLDSNLIHNMYPKSNYGTYSVFITQNYIYFVIMYLTVIIHKFINKVS